MKKLLITLGLLIGSSQFATSQNQVQINLYDGLCLDEITFEYLGGGTEVQALGCSGSFLFDIGTAELLGFTINGVFCQVNTNTEVIVNGGLKAKSKVVNVGNTIVDDLNGLIR